MNLFVPFALFDFSVDGSGQIDPNETWDICIGAALRDRLGNQLNQFTRVDSAMSRYTTEGVRRPAGSMPVHQGTAECAYRMMPKHCEVLKVAERSNLVWL